MNEQTNSEAYEGWAIVELMGHRRLGGQVRQVTQYGQAMLRIDIPADGDQLAATQFYGGGSIYALTPTTEAMARAAAARNRPEPVSRWELPQLLAPAAAAAAAKRTCEAILDKLGPCDATCSECEDDAESHHFLEPDSEDLVWHCKHCPASIEDADFQIAFGDD